MRVPPTRAPAATRPADGDLRARRPLLYALLAPAPTPTGAAADTEPRAQARHAPPAVPAAAHGRAAPAPTLVQFTASGVPAACAGEEAF